MTLAHHRSKPKPSNGSASDSRPVSDFHLVEDVEGWRLTVQVTDRLRKLLSAADEGVASDQPFTVHVEPNLLPGQPFAVTIEPVTDER
jgi:hypothetical protein